MRTPFREFVTKAADTVSRVPFTPDELKAIQEACAEDDFIRPVIITGMCTAMRRGDCCCLKWSDVDLKEGFISVKTSKTGEKVDIPIFPLLQEELERAKAAGKGSGYCFPKAAEMYQRNADGISIRVKAVLARARGFPGCHPQGDAEDVGKQSATVLAKRGDVGHPRSNVGKNVEG